LPPAHACACPCGCRTFDAFFCPLNQAFGPSRGRQFGLPSRQARTRTADLPRILFTRHISPAIISPASPRIILSDYVANAGFISYAHARAGRTWLRTCGPHCLYLRPCTLWARLPSHTGRPTRWTGHLPTHPAYNAATRTIWVWILSGRTVKYCCLRLRCFRFAVCATSALRGPAVAFWLDASAPAVCFASDANGRGVGYCALACVLTMSSLFVTPPATTLFFSRSYDVGVHRQALRPCVDDRENDSILVLLDSSHRRHYGWCNNATPAAPDLGVGKGSVCRVFYGRLQRFIVWFGRAHTLSIPSFEHHTGCALAFAVSVAEHRYP